MNANELVARIYDLAPAPRAALKLIGLLGHPSISNEDIVASLKCDNVLTAKLLKTCNSSFYGLSERVASVEQAVFVLGHQQIMQIVLSLAFNSLMTVPLHGYAIEKDELWRHSLVTALTCERLMKTGLPVESEPAIAFTSGLLHDIGKLALNDVLTPHYQKAIRLRINENGFSRIEAEHDAIGTDHAEVGACLLNAWNLPDDIVEAVGHHHAPEIRPRPRLSAVVHVADCLANTYGSTAGWDAMATRIAAVSDALDLTSERVEKLLATIHEAVDEVAHFEHLS